MGNIKILHVTRLKLFVGSREEAYKAALLDADQFVIRKIHYWRGNPEKRSEMFFFVEFDDGDKILLPYSKDLSSSVQFEDFVYAEPQLFPLRFNAADAPKRITAMRKEPIRDVSLHDVFYLDLCATGVMTGLMRSICPTRILLPMSCPVSMLHGRHVVVYINGNLFSLIYRLVDELID